MILSWNLFNTNLQNMDFGQGNINLWSIYYSVGISICTRNIAGKSNINTKMNANADSRDRGFLPIKIIIQYVHKIQ